MQRRPPRDTSTRSEGTKITTTDAASTCTLPSKTRPVALVLILILILVLATVAAVAAAGSARAATGLAATGLAATGGCRRASIGIMILNRRDDTFWEFDRESLTECAENGSETSGGEGWR